MRVAFGFARAISRKYGVDIQLVQRDVRSRRTDYDNLLLSGVNWLRVPMYSEMRVTLSRNFGTGQLKGRRAIEIGGSEGTLVRILTGLGAQVEVSPNYPQVDAENLPYANESYDVVVLDQVVEHLEHPWRAVQEMRRVLRPKGICVCTSVFIFPLHIGTDSAGNTYGDYYRFSPFGFKALFEGFDILSADGWGNIDAVKMTFDSSQTGSSLDDVRRLYDHSESRNHIVTWCIAQKKEGGG